MSLEITDTDRTSNEYRWQTVVRLSGENSPAVNISTFADLIKGHTDIRAVTDGTENTTRSGQDKSAATEVHLRDIKFPPSSNAELAVHDEMMLIAAGCAHMLARLLQR